MSDADRPGPRAMATPFKHVHHVCIVVRDIEKTAAYYTSLGIGPWEEMSLKAYADCQIPNPEGFFGLRFKRADIGAMQLQLCQPGSGDSPEKRFLDERGEGVFHIGFEVENIDAAHARAVEMQLPIDSYGRRADRTGFTYLGNAADAGVVLVLREALKS